MVASYCPSIGERPTVVGAGDSVVGDAAGDGATGEGGRPVPPASLDVLEHPTSSAIAAKNKIDRFIGAPFDGPPYGLSPGDGG